MLKASYIPYTLHFKVPSGTSRGILTDKETYLVRVWDDAYPDRFGVGECALFRGLGADDRPEYENVLQQVCRQIDRYDSLDLAAWSSIRFGVEMLCSIGGMAAGGWSTRRTLPTGSGVSPSTA